VHIRAQVPIHFTGGRDPAIRQPPMLLKLAYGGAVAIGFVLFAGTFCLLLWLLDH
jgi:hypothetical protein